MRTGSESVLPSPPLRVPVPPHMTRMHAPQPPLFTSSRPTGEINPPLSTAHHTERVRPANKHRRHTTQLQRPTTRQWARVLDLTITTTTLSSAQLGRPPVPCAMRPTTHTHTHTPVERSAPPHPPPLSNAQLDALVRACRSHTHTLSLSLSLCACVRACAQVDPTLGTTMICACSGPVGSSSLKCVDPNAAPPALKYEFTVDAGGQVSPWVLGPACAWGGTLVPVGREILWGEIPWGGGDTVGGMPWVGRCRGEIPFRGWGDTAGRYCGEILWGDTLGRCMRTRVVDQRAGAAECCRSGQRGVSLSLSLS